MATATLYFIPPSRLCLVCVSALSQALSSHCTVWKLLIRCASVGNLAFARGTFAMHNINMLDAMRSKNQFPYRFLCTQKKSVRRKAEATVFLTKCISNKIPLLLTRATGGSAHLKGARCNCSFEKDTVGGRVQYLQPCRIRAHISAKLI